MATESNDLHGMVPDSNDTALLLIDVINHLDFEGKEGLISSICLVLLRHIYICRIIKGSRKNWSTYCGIETSST